MKSGIASITESSTVANLMTTCLVTYLKNKINEWMNELPQLCFELDARLALTTAGEVCTSNQLD